ncbi:MAG: NIPSNAP family protein [Planctomycetales bacterium]|nr:NIPSNAP family protein [Planctomycetales bacterium]
MQTIVSTGLILLFCAATVVGQQEGNDDFYILGPDSLKQEGVPHGEVQGPFTLPSEAYEGTQHTYWIYVPAQYDPATPCCLMVFNDGHAFLKEDGSARMTNVIDNLTFRREIPVMISVYINPGRRADQPEPNASEWGDRTTNRPTEYNTLDDKYARVIVDELLPELDAKFNISKDPKDRGIGGCSSGAIAAFTVAWQRPDQFTKVLSTVGSFTNIRGGHRYPEIIRESEKKPIRVFFQDGRNDNRGQRRGGRYDETWDWFLQNVRMVEALSEKGYDVNYSWSIGRHGLKSGGVILPEMMRWLWRDQPVSVDVNDALERSFHLAAAATTNAPAGADEERVAEAPTDDESADSKAQENRSGRLYELRYYTTNPGKLPDLHARFRNHTMKLFEKHGMENIIYWTVAEGAQGEDNEVVNNTLIYIIAHQNQAAREASWQAFSNDPEWKEVAAKSEENGKILAKAPRSILMEATSFSPADFATNRDADAPARLFELRQYNDGPEGVPHTVDRFASGETELFTKHGMETISFWTASDNSAFIYLLAHKDRDAAKQSWQGFFGDFRDFMREYREAKAAAGQAPGPRGGGMEVRFLIPTDYSPRK